MAHWLERPTGICHWFESLAGIFANLTAYNVTTKLTNQSQRTRLKTPSAGKHVSSTHLMISAQVEVQKTRLLRTTITFTVTLDELMPL